jgi:uncharacterized membrane protein YedE/YeeE
MSMTDSAYMLSYFVSQGTMAALGSTLFGLGMKQGGMPSETCLRMTGAVLLFSLALISLSMVLSSMFTDSKLSA